MEICIDDRTNGYFNKKYEETISKVILATLEIEDFKNIGDMSVSIVFNEEIKVLNKKYRGIDRETDVLSFPLMENLLDYKGDTEGISLGDVIISIEKAESQAEEYGHTIEREIGFLAVHSVLHLLGYDHMNEKDEKIMLEKQEKVLESINLCR